MDAFEQIRLEAAERHDRLVAAGADPWKPLDLALAAAGQAGVSVEWLASGDPLLKGALAFFDPQMGSICCEDIGSEAERAFRVAHETGHVVLHGTAHRLYERDPGQAAGAAPVGMQKVDDYGLRERRERQADVFGREILLPRMRARRLYLDENMSASAIRTNSGLSIEVVRRQVLDALLIPAPAPAARKLESKEFKDDPSQERAAKHSGSPFVLQAGPGTGKTRTLVRRIRHLVETGEDPNSILVLTFSNRAAGELVERLAEALPTAAPAVWVGTFHSFGLDIVRRFHERLDLPPDPHLFDRSDAIEALEEVLPRLPLKHYRNLFDPTFILADILSAISRAKDEMADPERYRELARAMYGSPDAAVAERGEKCLEVADVYEAYETLKRAEGVVDFGDLVVLPALLLEHDEAVRAATQLRHRNVLVDEYQDVNRASVRLLKGIAGDGKRLWVVGDSRQSIYRFRGASSINMARFKTDFPGAAEDSLEVNYRSVDEIVGAFVGFSRGMMASAGVPVLKLRAESGAGGKKPEIRRYGPPAEELAGVVANVLDLRDAGFGLNDQAVLCRSNGRLDDVAAALEAQDVPILHLGNLFEREEVRDLLSLLTVVGDGRAAGLPRVAAMARYAIPLQDVHAILLALAAAEGGLRELDPATLPLSTEGDRGLRLLKEDLAGLSAGDHPWEVLATYLLDRTDLMRKQAGSSTVRDMLRGVAVWQLLNFTREQVRRPGAPIQRMLDRVRRLVILNEERDLRQLPEAARHIDAVKLMTVHGSKGLEFEAVHVPGMIKTAFPTSPRPRACSPPDGLIEGSEGLSGVDALKVGHEEEEECLFFVAMSRAKRVLSLTAALKQASGKNRAESDFLPRVAPSFVSVARPRTVAYRAAPPGGTVTVRWSEPPVVAAPTLSTYERCPRRYFYSHVLAVGGRRRLSAFGRMHDVLYALIDCLADIPPGTPVDAAVVDQAFGELWDRLGPNDHGYAEDYRRLASGLAGFLARSCSGRVRQSRRSREVVAGGGIVTVRADEVTVDAAGRTVYRRIRTGKKRADEDGDLTYALYHLLARLETAAAYGVEVVHLTDETVTEMAIADDKLAERRAKADDLANRIAAGVFPTKTNDFTCPTCPHYFICPAVPAGELVL